MAKTTVTHISDDIDGSTDADEVSFAYNGTEYTIDLSKKNRTALEKALKPYMESGTRMSRRASRRSGGSAAKSDTVAIREWARSQGIAVSERGRIPGAVVEQYKAAKG